MAQLEAACCGTEVQETCCEPEHKGECCWDARCGCDADAQATSHTDVGEHVYDPGLVDIEIRETHRLHEHAIAAIVRARKPSRRSA